MQSFGKKMTFLTGTYLVVRPTWVTPEPDTADPTEDDGFPEVEDGQEVEVVDVLAIPDMNIVPQPETSLLTLVPSSLPFAIPYCCASLRCGQIHHPTGWIRLMDGPGFCTAVAKECACNMQQ